MTGTGILTWLGGGRSADIHEGHERSGYLVTGAGVALLAAISALVTACALAAPPDPSATVVVVAAVAAALITGTAGRALATRRPGRLPDRLDLAARIGVAAVIGLLLGELACTVLFGGAIDRALDDEAQRGATTAAGVVAASTELDAARAERAALDRTVTSAQADIDRALIIARCEFNPTPECPQTRITGVPGRGPEAQTANDMLDDARAQLTAAQSRIAAADQRVTTGERALGAARATAFAEADRGFGARWAAMHEHTTASAGALLLRLFVLLVAVLLALSPLILRWWRGETSMDRHAAFRAVEERAELAADTAIARKRAEVRAEAEALRADQALTATKLAVEADTAIDRERQRTRIIAAIGGIELGVNEPRRPAEPEPLPGRPAALTAAHDRKDSSVADQPATPNLPATVEAGLVPAGRAVTPDRGGLELPIIGQVPFTDTAARWIRPLVPSFVANAFDTATHPLRTARQAFEEVEEITFTLRRTRKVTVDTQELVDPGYRPRADEADHARRVAATVVDAHYPPAYNLDPAERGAELGGGRHDELAGRHDPRELPRGR